MRYKTKVSLPLTLNFNVTHVKFKVLYWTRHMFYQWLIGPI